MNPVLHRMPQALTGDRSGLTGNCTGLRGNLDDVGLTDIERAAGVSISDLIIRDAQATGV